MKKELTIKEIKQRFDQEWVLLANPKSTLQMEVLGGEVVFHSKNRDEVYQKAIEVHPKHAAILFFGHIQQNAAVVL